MRENIMFMGLAALVLLVGCSARKVTTSVENQHLLQQQNPGRPEVPAGSLNDAERIAETPIAAPASPPPQKHDNRQSIIPPAESAGQTTVSRPPERSGPPAEAIGDVYFDYDRFSLRDDARATLEKNAGWLKSQHSLKILIEGHCDERGTLAYNLVLGERRAQSVKQYLQELGIPTSRLRIVSYGKERPFCTEHREACWQQNRRGHFVVK